MLLLIVVGVDDCGGDCGSEDDTGCDGSGISGDGEDDSK